MTIDNAPVWAGLAGLVINQIATHWRDERRHRHNVEDRAEAEKRAVQAHKLAEEKSSLERRRMMRHIQNTRPDSRCYQNGCPLIQLPAALPELQR